MLSGGAVRRRASTAAGVSAGKRSVTHQEAGRGADDAEMGEVRDRVVARAADQGGGRGGGGAGLRHHERVAVRRLALQPLGRHRAGGAGPVLHHDARFRPEMRRHAVGQDARGDVRAAARGVAGRHDDGPVGKGRGSPEGASRAGQGERETAAAAHVLFLPVRFSARRRAPRAPRWEGARPGGVSAGRGAGGRGRSGASRGRRRGRAGPCRSRPGCRRTRRGRRRAPSTAPAPPARRRRRGGCGSRGGRRPPGRAAPPSAAPSRPRRTGP